MTILGSMPKVVPQWLLRSSTSLLCSSTHAYALFMLWKLDLKKKQGAFGSSLATKWEPQSIRPSKNTKRFRKFCIRLTHFGSNFAPISHQILHLEKNAQKFIWFVHPLLPCPQLPFLPSKMIKWPASLKWTNRVNVDEQSNHCGSVIFSH